MEGEVRLRERDAEGTQQRAAARSSTQQQQHAERSIQQYAAQAAAGARSSITQRQHAAVRVGWVQVWLRISARNDFLHPQPAHAPHIAPRKSGRNQQPQS